MYKILRFLDHVLNHAELYKQNKCFCDQSSFPALTCKSVRFLQSELGLIICSYASDLSSCEHKASKKFRHVQD